MDPVLDDELKQSRIIKRYQQYQEQIDQINKTDKDDLSAPSGEMQGKKITKKIIQDNSQIENIFNNSIKR